MLASLAIVARCSDATRSLAPPRTLPTARGDPRTPRGFAVRCAVKFWRGCVALILNRSEVRGLLDPARAMEVLEPVMLEEVEGTSFHLPPSGGRNSLRVVGGGLNGMHRM